MSIAIAPEQVSTEAARLPIHEIVKYLRQHLGRQASVGFHRDGEPARDVVAVTFRTKKISVDSGARGA